MLHVLIEGISIWLLICVLVGPVFFALLGIAIHYTKRAAIWFAVGMLLSDIVYAMLAYGGVGALIFTGTTKIWMYIIGGLLFILMGWDMINKTRKNKTNPDKEFTINPNAKRYTFLGEGFLINTLNPGVIFLRIGVVGTTAPSYHPASLSVIFFLAIFATTFGTDLLKITLATSLKNLIHGKNLYLLHLITGVLLIGIGIFTIVKTLIHL